MMILSRHASQLGPERRLAYLALLLCNGSHAFLLAITGVILNRQSALSEYNAIGEWMNLPLLERDEATNNYRRSFNALFAVLQAGLLIETYLAVRSRSTFHFYLLALFHLYSAVHAFQEQSLWQFMVGTYLDEVKHNSLAWMEVAIAVAVTIAAAEWVFFSVAFHRLWGWRRLRTCGEGPKTRGMFVLHHVHSKLLKVSPFLLLGYLNRLLIQIPSVDGDSGLRMDFLRLLVGLGALSATIILPAYAGLHRESKPLTWVSIINMGLLFVVSSVYYVVGLERELQRPPINPWGDVSLHSVTIMFFVLGTLLLPGLMLLGVANMRNYNKGLKELRSSQMLLDDEGFGDTPADLDLHGVRDAEEPRKDQQADAEADASFSVHHYPPAAMHHLRFTKTLPGQASV